MSLVELRSVTSEDGVRKKEDD